MLRTGTVTKHQINKCDLIFIIVEGTLKDLVKWMDKSMNKHKKKLESKENGQALKSGLVSTPSSQGYIYFKKLFLVI